MSGFVRSRLKNCVDYGARIAVRKVTAWRHPDSWALNRSRAADRLQCPVVGTHASVSQRMLGLLVAAFGTASLGLSSAATAQSLYRGGAPMADVVQLPKFCWSRYVKELQTPEYRIPRECGPYMNHYCDAVLEWVQTRKIAKQQGSKALGSLKAAHKSALARYNAVKDYRNCPVRQHAESTLFEIQAMLQAMGGGAAPGK